jgi:multidrug resistance efflux pump
LAILSNAEAIASLAQARASYEAEKANLNDILKGTRPEKVAVNQAQVDSATSNLNSSQSSLRDALESTYSKADDVVHNTLDPLFDNDVSPSGGYNISPRLVYSPINVQLKSSIESKRAQLEKSLYDWKSQSDLGYVNITNSNILMAENTLSDISSLLNDITQSFVNSDKPSSISQATFDSWKSSVSLARSNISSASSLMSSADEKLSSAKTALAVAQNELSLSKAGATSDAILSERAKLTAAEAKVSQLEAQLSNTYIISPIDGVVASRNVDPGETVSISGASGSSASPAFTVISKSGQSVTT